jgi:sporulation related protein
MARGGRRAPQPELASRDVRWFSAAILATCLTVTALGLAAGLYLDRATEAPPAIVKSDDGALPLAPLPVAAVDMAPMPDAVPAAPSSSRTPTRAEPAAPELQPPPIEADPIAERDVAPPSPTAAGGASPPISVEHVTTLAAIEPQAGTSASAPTATVRVAAAITTPALPGGDGARRYWVEYAVFAHERSAEQLRHKLATLHLETSVVATHAPDGRRLWRVRSAMTERAGAEADARLARQTVAIKPLIHRGAPRPAPPAQYWVQFGAFPTAAPAVQLQRVLADNGVKASVREARTSAGKPLFLVRSDGFPDRKLATLVGELGGNAAKVAFRIGRSPPVRHAAGHHASPRGGTGSSLPPHRHAPRPGGG